jgi:hypothetical protein
VHSWCCVRREQWLSAWFPRPFAWQRCDSACACSRAGRVLAAGHRPAASWKASARAPAAKAPSASRRPSARHRSAAAPRGLRAAAPAPPTHRGPPVASCDCRARVRRRQAGGLHRPKQGLGGGTCGCVLRCVSHRVFTVYRRTICSTSITTPVRPLVIPTAASIEVRALSCCGGIVVGPSGVYCLAVRCRGRRSGAPR